MVTILEMRSETAATETDSDALTETMVECPPVAVDSDGRPDPQWVRGRCPECGDDLVSNMYYVGGKGYIIRWECWSRLTKPESDPARCAYYKVL
ncbi:MAG TPA: hypothetical protein VM490_00665 [Armatimonadaceae bacterium]|jgi:hypothetical protein|nr:hypothetical protein [Armatimonadaceae bacterium]